MAELFLGIAIALATLVAAFYYIKKPAFKTWVSVFGGFESNATPKITERIYGRLYTENLIFRSIIGASDSGVIIFNKMTPYFDKILLPWSEISIVEFHPSHELARILFSKPDSETQEVVLPWLRDFNKYVPNEVGFTER